ncbi:hypothetical protein [Sphingomonas abietis]|uniref:Uncharacterized protein n=1 Tax=Sphingomonas abietis TaxID=3012344 RepID=A0ABY7NSA3_9SPHN|nr:hypothetical protein [Sphingomonas abietis]WBO23452.1 hypothetical protein PBT88_04805 [Sphingomonas abietis]
MRWWVAASLLGLPAAGQAAPGVPMPLASGFDLSSLIVQPHLDALAATATKDDPRWTVSDLDPPPGPPQDRPKIRIRGKKVKMRLPF